jgi:hypothetical protein
MRKEDLQAAFAPVLAEVAERSRVADAFLDKDLYRIYIATLWANVVLDPADVGIEEADLETLHDLVNEQIGDVLGSGTDIRECFRFVNSKAGESAMAAAKLTRRHQELLLYFSSMILDPDGHRRWMESIRNRSER